MTIEEAKKELIKAYREFRNHITDDTDLKGHAFSELVMPNPGNPEFPLTVTVNEAGCLLSWGSVDGICGGEKPVSDICEVIADILGDGFTLISVYRNSEDFKARHASFCEMYETDGPELAGLQKRFEAPLSFSENLFSKWKGIIEITDWSGDNRKIYERIFHKRS